MSLQTIKIYPETKERVDKFKSRGTSYDDVLSQFLDYFESTGIKPNEIDSSPMTVTKKATERVVKIIRNIETKKLSKIMGMLEDILVRVSESDNQTVAQGEIFSSKEVEELVETIETLQEENSRLENRIEEILTTGNNDPKTETLKPNLDFLDAILKAVKELRDNAKSIQLQKDEYKIKKNILDRNLDTISNLIKNR